MPQFAAWYIEARGPLETQCTRLRCWLHVAGAVVGWRMLGCQMLCSSLSNFLAPCAPCSLLRYIYNIYTITIYTRANPLPTHTILREEYVFLRDRPVVP